MKIRHDGHEHEFEAAHGLPEPLPAGERILWQGAPDWRVLARKAFHARKLAIYFGVILVLRAATVLSTGGTVAEAAKALLMLAPLVLLAVGASLLMAWLTSRTTVYTITDKRVVMRIGIVLSLTFNLPLRQLATAGLRLDADGNGDIPLTLSGTDTIAFLHLWPHARPWHVARPEPMLRCVPDAALVSRVLAGAWSHATGVQVALGADGVAVAAQPAGTVRGSRHTALA